MIDIPADLNLADLPTFYEGTAVVALARFKIVRLDENKTASMVVGEIPIVPSRIVTASGSDLPVIPGASLAPGCTLVIPYNFSLSGGQKTSSLPGKISAVGVVKRGNATVYDCPIRYQAALAQGEEAVCSHDHAHEQ